MLACQNGHEQIALDLFRLHQIEYEAAAADENISSINTPNSANSTTLKTHHHHHHHQRSPLETSSWYFHIQKSIDECTQNSHTGLSTQLTGRLAQFKSDLEQQQQQQRARQRNISRHSSSSIMDQIPSPHLAGAAIDPDFHLIENLEDFTSFLNDESSSSLAVGNIMNDRNKCGAASVRKEDLGESDMQTMLDQSLINTLDNTLLANLDFQQMSNNSQAAAQNSMIQSQVASMQHTNFMINNQQLQQQQQNIACFTQPKQLVTQISQTKLNNDQDKKIKALADNIIAAMPYKIKTNSYSISNLAQQQQMQQKNIGCLVHQQQQQQQLFSNENEIATVTSSYEGSQKGGSSVLRRNATSFDDGYETSYRTVDSSGMSLGNFFFSPKFDTLNKCDKSVSNI
jgi:hypothetical protein